ncbi:MAG: hypothetical protein U5L45_06775 [Saprospiraceae bacterium]|nr:hypothetical protein [Saprospiraceae bacterium]
MEVIYWGERVFESEKSKIFLIQKHARPDKLLLGDFRVKRERASKKNQSRT